MKGWLIFLIFLIGISLGVAGIYMAPNYIQQYIPQKPWGKAEPVKGTVVAKKQDGDRLLVTINTAEGAILATFKKKVAEIDLLVVEGDIIEFVIRGYSPFIEDPLIKSVKKKGSLIQTKPEEEAPQAPEPDAEKPMDSKKEKDSQL